MKKLAKVVEVEGDHLVGALGQKVLIFGVRYNYSGVMTEVNDKFLKLTEAVIVFDTGDFAAKNWAAAETPKSSEIYVNIAAIESWVTY